LTAVPRLPTPDSRLLTAVLAQTRMELVLAVRRGESLLITAVVPLALLLFFASVPLAGSGSDRPIDFLLPGVLALAVMSTSMVSLGIATGFERQYGVLKRLGASPLPRTGLLAAKMLAVLVVQSFQTVLLMLAAGMLFSWRPDGQPLWALASLLAGTLTFAAFGLLMAGALRAEATLASANALYLVFLLLGDMLFPLDQLPAWLAAAARLLPAAALSSALRASLEAGPPPVASVLITLVWGIGASLAAARTFRWE
jgi:ABC-2 type transport system permease protein